MLVAGGGGGGGGSYVGLHPAGAGALDRAIDAAGDAAAFQAWQVNNLLAQAGPDGNGTDTATVLRGIADECTTAAADLRWRIAVLTVGGFAAGGGVLVGVLPFASADAADAAGRSYAERMADQLHAGVYGDGESADAAMQQYFAMLRGAGAHAHDPAWTGGFVAALGADGIANVVWFSQGEADADVQRTRALIAPVATALATAMRAGTAAPSLTAQLLDEVSYRLGLLLTAAPPDTDFLVAAARSRFVAAAWTPDRFDDLLDDEATFFLEALAGDAEASHQLLTGVGPAGERGVVHLLQPIASWGHDAGEALARVLQQGLVAHPAGAGVATWNAAADTTADAIELAGRMKYQWDDVHPDLSVALLGLLRPHLDAVAVAGIAAGDIDRGHYDVDVVLPDRRQPLDATPEQLRDFLGGILHDGRTIGQLQAYIAGYAQSPQAQAHRLPLIDPQGRVADLEPFVADSLRIAGLMTVAGQGLDSAGHDEESRTRLLTGSLQFASKQGINKVVGWTGPLGWAAKQTAGRGASWAVDRFSEWVATFEPIEGEEGVDALLDGFTANTRASLREHMAADPAFERMSPAEQDDVVAHATRIAGDMVRAQLLAVYADLTGETAGE